MLGKRKPLIAAGLICLLLGAGPFFKVFAVEKPAAAGDQKALIDPRADRLLREVGRLLSGAKDFSFKAEVWEDLNVGGHKLATTKHLDLKVHRPDHLRIEVRSPQQSRAFWYDGKAVTLLDRLDNVYSVLEMQGNIDQAFDAAEDRYGIVFPLDDLLANDPYGRLSPEIQEAGYFGKVTVLGTLCHYLGVSTKGVDLQLWLSAGSRPLPRKLVITYKLEDAAPQYTAIFSDWKFNRGLPEKTFVFRAPPGAALVEALPVTSDDQTVSDKK